MLAVNSVFQINEISQARVLFDDATFARSDRLILDTDTGHVHAFLNDCQILIGHLSGRLVETFSKCAKVTLSAQLSDGSILNMDAELIVLH